MKKKGTIEFLHTSAIFLNSTGIYMIDADPFNILLNQRCLFSNLSNAKICSIRPHVVGKCAVGEIRLSENVDSRCTFAGLFSLHSRLVEKVCGAGSLRKF